MTAPQQPQHSIYGTFCAEINQQNVEKILRTMSAAMANRVTHVHLLFQSSGGFVGDGVALYNFFRSLPVDLTLYNVGTVASVATIAYLGAKKRKASAHAAFMIHRTMRQELTTARRLEGAAQSLRLDDQRTEAILRAHVRLPVEKWNEVDYHDLTFSAQDAVKFGIAQEICEFAPPTVTDVFSIS